MNKIYKKENAPCRAFFLMEKCEMKGLIKTDLAVVVLYFVKIYTGKEFQKIFIIKYKVKIKYKV